MVKSSSKAQNEATKVLIQWKYATLICFALIGTSMSTWLGRIPTVRDILDAQPTIIALIVLCLALGSVTGLVFGNKITANMSLRKVIFIFLACFTMTLIVVGVAIILENYFLILVSLYIFGIGFGANEVAVNVTAAAIEQLSGKTLMPLFHAMFSAGTVLGIIITILTINFNISLLLHFSIISVFIFTSSILVIKYIPRVSAISPKNDYLKIYTPELLINTDSSSRLNKSSKKTKSMWLDKRTILIGIIALGMAYAEGSANDWLPLALIDGHSFSESVATFGLAVFMFFMTIGRFFGGPVVDKMGRVRVLIFLSIFSCVGIMLTIFTQNYVLIFAGIILWGLGASLGFPLAMSAAADNPKTAPESVSVVATIGYGAFIAGPTLIGLAAEKTGILYALLIVLLTIIVAGVLSPAVRQIKED